MRSSENTLRISKQKRALVGIGPGPAVPDRLFDHSSPKVLGGTRKEYLSESAIIDDYDVR